MKQDVDKYKKSCVICNKSNAFRPKHTETLQKLEPTAYGMGDQIHIDLLAMPKSVMGHVAICTLVDAATEFVITNPVFDKTSAGVAQTILEKFIPDFGCPKVLVTDKDKENVNSEISLLCTKCNIKHITSSTYHPQSNGLVERRQQMILNFLRKITTSADSQGNWPNLLHEFQLITNSTLSQTRGFSPFFLTFFRTPNFPFNNILSDRHQYQNTYVTDKINNAKRVLQKACDNYNASFKEHGNPHAPLTKTIHEGNIIYVRHTQRVKLNIKLAQPFKRPFICVEVLHNNNVALSPLAGGKIIHTHLNNCKIVPLRPDHLVLNPLPTTPPSSNNSANDFRYSQHSAESFVCTEEDNAPAPPQPTAPPSRSLSPAPAASPLAPLPLLLLLIWPPQSPPANPPAPTASGGARPKVKLGRPTGKKPLTANDKFRLRKQQEAASKQTKPLTCGAKKITGAELLPYQHGRLPFEGRFNELVDKVLSALTPKKRPSTHTRSKVPKERKVLDADVSDAQESETEEWTDTESYAET